MGLLPHNLEHVTTSEDFKWTSEQSSIQNKSQLRDYIGFWAVLDHYFMLMEESTSPFIVL